MKTRYFAGAVLGVALAALSNSPLCWSQSFDSRPDYELTLLSLNDESVTSISSAANGSVAPWLTQDVGAVGIPGNAVLSNGVFQVSGSGRDIWDTSDQFRFVYLPLIGDGTIVARVVSVGNTDPAAKAGIMFRQSLDPGSVNAAVIVSYANGTGLTYRNEADGTTFIASDVHGAPFWVKMIRTGRKFTGFTSPDGTNWKQVAQPDILMSDPVLVGLCVTAHNNSALNVSTFDNVSVTGNTNVVPSPLPPPWTNNDVGAVGLAGSASYSNGTFTVSGAGADIFGSADAFQFVWQPLHGDGEIIARVASVGNTDPGARAGVMFRQSLSSGAVNAAVIVSASNGTGLTYRNVPDGTTFIQGDTGQAPYWVKMNRTGSKFTGFISSDGMNWKQVAQPDIVMTNSILVGLCVTAHNSNALSVCSFDHVTVTGGTNVQPSTLPPPWTNNDVGAVGLAGSAGFSNGTFTVSGSGSDIFGAADAFQYVWQPLTGDGTIVARVVSVSNTDPGARAGVMLRQSLAAGSVNAAVIVSAANGTGLTYRNVPDGTTFIQGDSGHAPYWVKMNRTGSKFTGFISPDGVNWKQIAQPDIAMSGSILVGLCVTAHNNAALNVSVFDNVTVTGGTNPPPSSLPPPWVNNDVGSVGLAGSSSYSNGTFGVSGSGADIFGSSDAFQYAWQPLWGDGIIIARVVSVGNTDPGARGGVMFRQSLAAGSVNAAVIVSAANGTGLTYRNVPDGTTFIQGDAGQVPYWVRMDRTGRKFTGYISSDGFNWKRIAQPDIPMSDPILVGLCVTAHNNNALNTTLFDNVMVIQTNSWTSPVSGNWHDLTWSLGVRPNIFQSAILITNSGQKIVTINTTTRDSYPDSLTISNFTLAGTPTSTNTLLIDQIGSAKPFEVFDTCTVGTNAVILNRDSVFKVSGFYSRFSNSGTVTQSGGSNLFENICAIENSGIFDLINGTTRAGSLDIGDGTPGCTYNQHNGVTITEEIRIGSYPTGGFFNLFNGSLTSTFLGTFDNGTFHQSGGSADIAVLYLFSGSSWLSNGSLATKQFSLAIYGDTTFTQFGGTHKSDSVIVPAHAERWFGSYLLKGGVFCSKTSEFGNPGGMNQTGGTNLVENLNIPGDYELRGGVLQSSNVIIGPQGDIFLGAILNQTGGEFTSESIALKGDGTPDSSSVLSHAGGSLTNTGDFVFLGGQLNPNNATGHLGSLVLKGNLRSHIVCSTGPFVEIFLPSAQKVWDSGTNTLLVIVNWKGSTAGGGLHQIYVGNSAAGLTPTQLSQIRFLYTTGQTFGARILNTGELVPDTLPLLSGKRIANGLILNWPTNCTLQTATNVAGPYHDMTGACAPMTNAFTDSQRFFRVRY